MPPQSPPPTSAPPPLGVEHRIEVRPPVPAEPQAPPSDTIEWKRPHPYTLIIEFVQSVQQLIIPIAFLLFQGSGDTESLITEVLPLIAVITPIGFAVARYFTTRYALTEEALLHQFGVFKKNKQVLPRRNIQNLSTSAGLVARATGLVELTISDASQGGDITLRLLSAEDGESMMSLLREDISTPATTSSNADASVSPFDSGASGAATFAPPSATAAFVSDPTYTLALSDLVKFRTVTSSAPVMVPILIAAGAVALYTVPDIVSTDDWSFLALLGPIFGVVLIPAFAPLFSLGGFRLWSDPDRLRIKAGLLTEVQLNARRERIQLVQVDRHVLSRKLGIEAIKFETADVEAGTSHINYLAPAVAADSWPVFASDALGKVELGEADLRRVSPLTARRSLVRFSVGAIPLIALFAAAAAIAPGSNSTVVGAVGVVTLVLYVMFALWFSRRRARRLGWAVGETQFLFRNGVLAEKLVLVRKEKLQVLRIHQSFFQRRLGLATLTLGTAGLGLLGLVSLPDLEEATANRLLLELAEASAATPLARTL